MDAAADDLEKLSPAYLRTRGQLFNAGFTPTRDPLNPSVENVDFSSSRIEQLWRESVIGDLVAQAMGKGPSGWQKVFTDKDIGVGGKAAYTGGRVLHDLIADGSRIPYWFLNHPLAATSAAAEIASVKAGLSPDYGAIRKELTAQGKGQTATREHIDRIWARRQGFDDATVRTGGLPANLAKGVVPLATAMAMIQTSGNHDLNNLVGGGRTPGYAAVLPSETDQRQTTNAPLELVLRYIAGRTGRILPWEEFTEERPEIPKEDWNAARMHQWEKGLFDVGLIKGTGRNLEGEPEFTMMGFRVPFSAASTAVGGMIGAGIGGNLAAEIGERMDQRRRDNLNYTKEHTFSLKRPGNRRIVGALAGLVAGGLTGNVGSRVINEQVIQPTFYPERVAAEEAWERDALRRSILQKQAQQVSGQTPPSPTVNGIPPQQ